jgi:hypothetical protein
VEIHLLTRLLIFVTVLTAQCVAGTQICAGYLDGEP